MVYTPRSICARHLSFELILINPQSIARKQDVLPGFRIHKSRLIKESRHDCVNQARLDVKNTKMGDSASNSGENGKKSGDSTQNSGDKCPNLVDISTLHIKKPGIQPCPASIYKMQYYSIIRHHR